MKLVKRLIPIMLSLIMALSMLPTGAFAVVLPTSSGSLTMKTGDGTATKSTSSYSAYQIVSWYAGSGSNVYTNMAITSTTYRPALLVASGLTDGTPPQTDTAILTAISSSATDAANIKTLAYALQTVATGTPTYTTTIGVFSSMASGYYLVIETANASSDGTVISKPILVGIGNSSVSCNVKTSKANIEKKIVESGVGLVDSNTAALGDTVNYQSKSEIPAYPTYKTNIAYYVTDTLSAGLTFVPSSVVVKIVDSSGTVQATPAVGTTTGYALATSGQTFSVTLNNSDDIKTWGAAGWKMLVTYSATVNSSAVFGSTGNPNTITLSYSTFPGVYSTSDTVITYAAALIITKTGNGEVKLSGAKFILEKYFNSSWVQVGTEQTTDANGQITFNTLKQGNYRVTETVAPTDYNLLAAPIEFTVTAKNNDTTLIPVTTFLITESGNTAVAADYKATWSGGNTVGVNTNGYLTLGITDTKGFTLPGTGGIGTTIFTVGGIAILLLGIFMVLVYTKKRKTENHR